MRLQSHLELGGGWVGNQHVFRAGLDARLAPAAGLEAGEPGAAPRVGRLVEEGQRRRRRRGPPGQLPAALEQEQTSSL